MCFNALMSALTAQVTVACQGRVGTDVGIEYALVGATT